jgi:TP901 family phage tail tape measure protein
VAVQVGSAWVDVHGDFSSLMGQASAFFAGSKWKKAGAGAAVGIGAVTVAAGAAGAALYQIGEDFDQAYDTIRVRTGATGKELRRLKGDFREVVADVPTDFDTAGKAIAGLQQRLDIDGKPLQRLTKQVLELSRITDTDVEENVESITRLFGDWSIKTGEQGETLDRLFRTSQETGIGISDLSRLMVQFGSPLRQLGLDFDFSAAMFARFEKEGVNIQTLMPGLRFALKQLSGATPELTAELEKLGIDLKDPSKALADVFELIEKAPTDLKANALAFKVFGVRAGPDMAAAIREGRFELDDLMKTIERGDDTIRKAGRQTMDLSEHWQVFKNNMELALEPTARKVFEELGDLMEDITGVMRDKSLTGEQKFDRIVDLITDKVEEVLPEVAEAGGKIGVELAKAVFNAFIDAPILGKLFIAGTFLKLIGGAGVLTSLGKTLGTKVAGPMATTIAAKIATDAIRGGGIYAALAGVGAIAGPVAGAAFAAYIGYELAQTDWAKSFVADTETHNVFDLILEQEENVTASIRRQIRAAERAGDAITVAQVRAWEKSGEISEEGADAVIKQLRRVERASRENREAMGRGRGIGFAQALAADGKATHREIQQILRDLKDLPKGAREEAANTMIGMARIMEQKGQLPKGSARRLRKAVVGEFEDTKVKSVAESAEMVRKLVRNFSGLVDTVGSALGILGKNTNKALKAYGVKELSFDLLKAGGKSLLGAVFKQRGGHIDMGAPSGDSVHAVLERDEYVLNREAVRAIGVDVLDRINFGAARRFQKGGAANLRGGFNVDGARPGFVPLMNYLNSLFGPIYVMSGLRPGSITTSGNLSNHATGRAVDISTTENNLDAATSAATLNATGAAAARMDRLHGFMAQQIPLSQVPGDFLWRTYTGGNHFNHIHRGITSGIVDTAAAMMQFLSTLPEGGAMGGIPKLLLKGPKGMLRDLGQGAIDKVWKAASAYLAEQASSAQYGTGPIQGIPHSGTLSREDMRRLLPSVGLPDIFYWIASAESGLDPTARNPSGASGLFQIMMPLHQALVDRAGGNVFDPVTNAKVAKMLYEEDGLAPWSPSRGTWGSHVGDPSFQRGGLVGQIRGLYDDLRQVGTGKAREKAGERIQDKIKELTGRLGKRRKRSERRKLKGIGVDVMLPNAAAWVNHFTEQVNVLDDHIGRLEIKHGGTEAPGSLEDALSMLGMSLGSDGEWNTLTPDVQKQISDLLGVEYGREESELNLEIAQNEKLMGFLVNLRNSLIVALQEAEKQIRQTAEAIETAKEKQREAERDAERLGKEADRLEERLGRLPNKGHQAEKRRLRVQIDEKRFRAGERRKDARFHGRQIEALKGVDEKLVESRDEYRTQLDEVHGHGSPMAIAFSIPPLTEGGIPMFGGRLLELQDRLRELGSTKIITPDFTDSASAGSQVSELDSLKLQLAMDEIARLRVEFLQRPVLENWDRYFASQLPKFHTGGVAPGPRGYEQPVAVTGGEGIFTPEQMEALGPGGGGGPTYLLIEDGAVDRRAIRQISAEEYESRSRRGARGAGSGPVAGALTRRS